MLFRPPIGLALILSSLHAPLSAHGAEIDWATATNNWFDVNSAWTGGARPNINGKDLARFNSAGSYEVRFDNLTDSTYGGYAWVNDLVVSAGTVNFITTATPRRTLSVSGAGGTQTALVTGGSTLNLGSSSDSNSAFRLFAQNIIELNGGATFNVLLGSEAAAAAGINVGRSFVNGAGTLLVDGNGSSAVAGGLSTFGDKGGTATVTFSGGATGTFADVKMADDAASTATLNVQGAGSAVVQTGASTLTVGHSTTGTATINIGTSGSGASFTTGTGLTTIKQTGTVSIGSGVDSTGSLAALGNVTIDGGLLEINNAVSAFYLANGTTMNIQNGGRATFTRGYTTADAVYNISDTNSKMESASTVSIRNGGQINVSSGGMISSQVFLDVAVFNSDGTLVVDGSDSSAIASGNEPSYWGNDATANVTFSNNATGTFNGGIDMAIDVFTGDSTALVNVLSGADLNVGNLTLAVNGEATTVATLNVQGAGSNVTQTGVSTLTVGHSAAGTAAINIGTSDSGATFTTGTGLTTIHKTGTITVGGGLNSGTLNVHGDLLIDGGVLSSSLFGGSFSLAASKTMTIQGGGRATFGGGYHTASGAVYHIVSANSKLETLLFNLTIASGAAVNVDTGGRISSGSGINIASGLGVSGNGTLTVDGSISSSVANAGSAWGGGGATANVSFSNGASGTFSDLELASDSTAGTTALVNVYSGADLTTGSLTLAAAGGASTTATLNMQGAGSTVVQTGASTLTVGHSTSGTAAINIGTTASGASLTTGTGLTTINDSGAIQVGSGYTGSFFAKGDMLIDGGSLVCGAGSSVDFDAGKTITIQNRGLFHISDDYQTPTNSVFNISDHSSLQTIFGSLDISNSAHVNVTSGGVASYDGMNVGTNSAGTLSIDGSEANATILSFGSTSHWGSNGGTASVTFSNESRGYFGGIHMGDGGTGSTAHVNIESGALLRAESLFLATTGGAANSAILNIDNYGQAWVTNILTVGHATSGSAAINIGFGSTLKTGTSQTTIHRTGTITVGTGLNPARLEVNGDLLIDGGVLDRSSVSTFSLASGRAMTVTGGGRATFEGGFAAISQVYSITGAGSKFETTTGDLIIGGGSVVNVGAGAPVSSGANIVLGGATLAIDAGGNVTAVGLVSVSSGTLKGDGTITGNVSNTGVVAPGQSPGALHISGNYSQTAGGTLRIEIGGTSPVTQYDQLLVAGAATLAGTLNVELINAFLPQLGDSFNILDWSSHTGVFATLQLPTLTGPHVWNTSRLYSEGVLSVILAGDYNHDGTVDAADYVAWRKIDGTQEGYDTWRANFGAQSLAVGAGNGSSSSTTVPESASTLLLIFAAAMGTFRGRRIASRVPSTR